MVFAVGVYNGAIFVWDNKSPTSRQRTSDCTNIAPRNSGEGQSSRFSLGRPNEGFSDRHRQVGGEDEYYETFKLHRGGNRKMAGTACISMGCPSGFYLSTPAPIMFVFFPWYWVITAIGVFGFLWSFIGHFCVNVTVIAIVYSMVIWARWLSAIGSAIYLMFVDYQPVPAMIALVWPFLSSLVRVPGNARMAELTLANKIGFVPQDDAFEERQTTRLWPKLKQS